MLGVDARVHEDHGELREDVRLNAGHEGLDDHDEDHEARANLHVGGRAALAELTARDREICARLGPVLRDKGVILAGIDVLGDYLTEINITSPTGFREIERLGGGALERDLLDAVEARSR